jgi:hypothetical protein
MSYWRRPKFWLILVAAELAGFVLSAVFAMVCELGLEACGFSNRWFQVRVDIIGGLANLYMAYDAFRFARSRMPRLPESRGFPVILRESAG